MHTLDARILKYGIFAEEQSTASERVWSMGLRVLARNLREKRSNPIDCLIYVCVLYGRPADVEILCKSVLIHVSFLHPAFLPLFGA